MKKILILILLIGLFVGCSDGNDNGPGYEGTNQPAEGSYQLAISLDVAESTHDKYLLFFMTRGVKKTGVGEPTIYGYRDPIEIQKNGEVVINLEDNFDFQWEIDADEDHILEVYVTTPEDVYIRNPLNQKTEIKFLKGNMSDLDYLSPVSKLTIPIVDKYPDGVITLANPDAVFVIKLELEEGFKPVGSFLVCVHWDNPDYPDEIGLVRTGRGCHSIDYWETPFFSDEMLPEQTGKIVVEEFDSGRRVEYVGFPKTLSFDGGGNCFQGDVIRLTIPNYE